MELLLNKIRLFFKHSISLAILLGLLVCCTPKESTEVQNCTFNQTEMLAAYYSTTINPSISTLTSAAEALNNQIQNQDINLSTLDATRGLYINLLDAYQAWEIFKFHPSSANGTMYNRLNIFPTDTTAVLNNNLNQTADVSILVKDQVGLPALEFLLFGNEGMSNEAVVNRLTAGNYSYLKALSQNILNNLTAFQTDWNNYSSAFTTTTGSGDGTPLALFANSFVQDFEYLKNVKMKIPAGRYDRVLKPHFAEGYFAQKSIDNLLLHLDRLINVFNNNDASGLDDYCACLSVNRTSSTSLDNDILNGFNTARNTLSNLQGKKIQDVLNSPTDLDVFNTTIDQLQAITPFLKSEMIPYMGVKISYQDNDGD